MHLGGAALDGGGADGGGDAFVGGGGGRAGGCVWRVGGAGLDGGVAEGGGDAFVDVGVEGVGDELGLVGEVRYGLGGGELHPERYVFGAGEQGAPEDAGVAEHIVHARAVGGEGGPGLQGGLGLDLWVRVGQG